MHCLSLKHADAVLFLVGLLLEEHVVNEEASSEQGCLAPHIQVHWETRKQILKSIRFVFNILFDPPCKMQFLRSCMTDSQLGNPYTFAFKTLTEISLFF